MPETRVNLDYQVDQTQFDEQVKDAVESGLSEASVVNQTGDEMSGELILPTLSFNSIYSNDAASIYGSQVGVDSTLHIRYGVAAPDKLEIEFYNGSSASIIMSVDGNKDLDWTVNSFDITTDANSVLTIGNDFTLTATSTLQLNATTIEINQNNNKIRVDSGKWQITNNGTDWFDIQEEFPIGAIMMYRGSEIADVATRTEEIGQRAGDTVKLPGWYVCNGQGSTPNLLNKFIRCQSASDVTGGSDNAIVVRHNHVSQTAGSHDHGAATQLDGSHTHSVTGGNHNHTERHFSSTTGHRRSRARACANDTLGTYTTGGSGNHSHSVTTHSGHTHTIDSDGGHTHTIDDSGSSGTSKNMPAYYSLIFIVKVS